MGSLTCPYTSLVRGDTLTNKDIGVLFRHFPQVALAVPSEDGGSSIKTYKSRKSHGKIGDCEQFSLEADYVSWTGSRSRHVC